MHRRARHCIGKALGANIVLDSRYLTDADGTALQTWTDRSGNGKDASQATLANRPLVKTGSNGINGNPVVQYDGSNDFMTVSSFTVSANMYVLLVTKMTSANMVCEQSVNNNSNDGFYVYGQQNRNVNIRRGSNSYYIEGTANWMGTSNTVICWSYGTVKQYYKDFAQITKVNEVDQSPSGNATDTVYIMSRGGSSLFSSGLLGMLIVQGGDATLSFLKRVNHAAGYSFKIACS